MVAQQRYLSLRELCDAAHEKYRLAAAAVLGARSLADARHKDLSDAKRAMLNVPSVPTSSAPHTSNILSWDRDKVVEWLQNACDISIEVAQMFWVNSVDGKLLLTLSDAELKDDTDGILTSSPPSIPS